MTKHTYTKDRTTCVALLGEYKGDDLLSKIQDHYSAGYRFPMKFRTSGECLRPDPKERDPLKLEKTWNSVYFTEMDIDGAEVLLQTHLYGILSALSAIHMMALDTSGKVKEGVLKQHLDDLLTATGVREIDSEREAYAFQSIFDALEKGEYQDTAGNSQDEVNKEAFKCHT